MDIESLREICLSFRGVTEDIKWEDHICFSVGGKMFLVTGAHEPPVTASFKTTDEDFEDLSERPGFKPAPYMARNKWILAEDIDNFSKTEWEHYLHSAYELIKSKLPKKLIKAIDEGV